MYWLLLERYLSFWATINMVQAGQVVQARHCSAILRARPYRARGPRLRGTDPPSRRSTYTPSQRFCTSFMFCAFVLVVWTHALLCLSFGPLRFTFLPLQNGSLICSACALVFGLFLCTIVSLASVSNPLSRPHTRSDRERVRGVAASVAELAVAQVCESQSAQTTHTISVAAHEEAAAAAIKCTGEPLRLAGSAGGAVMRIQGPARGGIGRGGGRGRGGGGRAAGRMPRKSITWADKLTLIELRESGQYKWAEICARFRLRFSECTAREM